jgi:hypothetical protein
MSIPNYDDSYEIELTSDADLLDRVSALLQRANTRQVWLMFLDDEHRQLPLLMPSYVPRVPGERETARLGGFFRELSTEVGATTIVPTYERRGRADLTDTDQVWLQTLHNACVESSLGFRGPLLCHSTGVRWVPLDEYIDEQCS